jgi:hypothetical protein
MAATTTNKVKFYVTEVSDCPACGGTDGLGRGRRVVLDIREGGGEGLGARGVRAARGRRG